MARENGLAVCGDEESPVASLIVGDDKLAMILSHNLLERGIEVQPIVRPAVSATTARLRCLPAATDAHPMLIRRRQVRRSDQSYEVRPPVSPAGAGSSTFTSGSGASRGLQTSCRTGTACKRDHSAWQDGHQ